MLITHMLQKSLPLFLNCYYEKMDIYFTENIICITLNIFQEIINRLENIIYPEFKLLDNRIKNSFQYFYILTWRRDCYDKKLTTHKNGDMTFDTNIEIISFHL